MNSGRRTIRGTVEAIQESWPLQLIVRTGQQERVAVALTDQTVVVRAGRASDASTIRANQRVVIDGVISSVEAEAMVAERIEIQT